MQNRPQTCNRSEYKDVFWLSKKCGSRAEFGNFESNPVVGLRAAVLRKEWVGTKLAPDSDPGSDTLLAGAE